APRPIKLDGVCFSASSRLSLQEEDRSLSRWWLLGRACPPIFRRHASRQSYEPLMDALAASSAAPAPVPLLVAVLQQLLHIAEQPNKLYPFNLCWITCPVPFQQPPRLAL